jgi:plastocyanin
MGREIVAAIVLSMLAGACANAATVDVAVVDKNAMPAPDTVITLEPEGTQPLATRVPEKAIIDQRNETFIPLVTVVRKGGRVVFTNNDVTMHQVYSFSAIKQFQFVIKQGEVSAPVVFDQPGVAAVGCNIHDQMITYVFVADAPFAAVSDGQGHAVIQDVPPGRYRISLWHPQLPVGEAPLSQSVAVDERGTNLSPVLPVAVMAMHGMKHMHMGY